MAIEFILFRAIAVVGPFEETMESCKKSDLVDKHYIRFYFDGWQELRKNSLCSPMV